MTTAFDPAYMVKQYLTRLCLPDGRVFDVFNTGAEGTVLFCPIAGADSLGLGGWQTGIQAPIRRADLKPEIRRLIPRP